MKLSRIIKIQEKNCVNCHKLKIVETVYLGIFEATEKINSTANFISEISVSTKQQEISTQKASERIKEIDELSINLKDFNSQLFTVSKNIVSFTNILRKLVF